MKTVKRNVCSSCGDLCGYHPDDVDGEKVCRSLFCDGRYYGVEVPVSLVERIHRMRLEVRRAEEARRAALG